MKNKSSDDGIKLGDWYVLIDQNQLVCANNQVTLLPKVMVALEYFILNPQRVITFDELNQVIWPNEVVGDNSIYNLIGQLRKSLGDVASNPKYIETISKKGYRLIAKVTVTEKNPEPEIEIEIETAPPKEVPNEQTKSAIGWPALTGTLLVILFSIVGYFLHYQATQPSEEITTSESLPALAQQFLALAKHHQYKSDKENKLLAVDYYQKVVALAPTDLNSHLELSYLNVQLMALITEERDLFYSKAKRWVQSAQSLEPQHTKVLLLTDIIEYLGKDKINPTELTTAFERRESSTIPPSTSEFMAIAHLQFKQGHIEQAITLLDKAAKGCTNCADVYLQLAYAYMVNMTLDKASTAFNRYHELSHYDDNNPVKLSNQGAITLNTLKAMYQWYKKSPRTINKPYQQNHLTLLLLNMGLFNQAVDLTQQRNITQSSTFFTLYTLAAVAGAQQDFAQSLKYLKKRQQLYPHNLLFSQSLSIAYWMHDDANKALSILQTNVLAKASTPANYHLLLATLLKATGQTTKANQLFINEKTRLENHTTQTLNNQVDLAVVYAQLGDNQQAIASLKSALDSGWVNDFNLNWWRLEDNPFLAPIHHEAAFKSLVRDYYSTLESFDDR